MKTDTRLIAALGLFLGGEALLIACVDGAVADFMRQMDASHHDLVDFFRAFTDLGKSKWYLWPCGIATICCALLSRGKDVPQRYRRLFGSIGLRALFLFATVGISGILTDIVKPILGRARPVEMAREGIYGFSPLSFNAAWNSLPSGHATTAMALAFSLAVLVPRGRAVWIGLGVILAASRVVVDAHFVSDIVAGGLVGYGTVQGVLKYGMVHAARIFPIDRIDART